MTHRLTSIPVLIDVNPYPDVVVLTGRFPSGQLIVQPISRPAWVRPGENLENSDELPSLWVWSKNPVESRDALPSAPPVLLAHFQVNPNTSEGAAALAALGVTRWAESL